MQNLKSLEASPLRWLVAALYANAILWSIPWVRPGAEAVARLVGSHWWVGAVGVAFGAAAISWAAWSSASLRTLLVTGTAYLALVAYLRAIPDEVVHLAEYGLLSLLLWWALAPSAPRAAPALALAGATLLGLADEWTQGATPGRYFDWRDVAVNAVSAALPLALFRRPAAPPPPTRPPPVP